MKCKDWLLQTNFPLNKFESNSTELEQMINGKVHEYLLQKSLACNGMKSMQCCKYEIFCWSVNELGVF